MGYLIAIAGKGGTGKTTLAALLVRLIRENKIGSVLAVDADPNSNLAEALGVKPRQTIGAILDKIARDPSKIPAGMPKERFIEYEVQTAVEEAEGFDILTMGRPEGPGCYCYVNNVLRNIMAKLIGDYDYIVIDNEAGLEHLSRRTTRSADALLVISDATPVGLKAAKRMMALVKELEIKTKKNLLIINRATLKDKYRAGKNREKVIGASIDFLGYIPYDSRINRASINGNSIMQLKNNAPSLAALGKLKDKIL